MDKSWVVKSCEGPLMVEKRWSSMIAVECILIVLSDKLYDVYMNIKSER